jgi:predicted nucleotidyltransferase
MEPDRAELNELVERIRRVVDPVRVILFGSAARGEMGQASDLDVLVIVRNGTDTRAVTRRVYRELIGSKAAADVVVATEEEIDLYGDNYSLVYYRALREGKEICAAQSNHA